jgi:hypothetical protein
MPERARTYRNFVAAFVVLYERGLYQDTGVSCPAPLATVTPRFTATGRQATAVAVAAAGCMADTTTVNGRQQPSLRDTAGGLESMTRKLLGLA